MRDELLEYYERELSYLRRSGAQFARDYPKVASRLLLEPNKCDDPHVERILEGFAFLAARIHLKIDDDFSEVSEALLGMVSPHAVRPVPSLSLVEFQTDPERGKLTSGLTIPKGSVLLSRPVRNVPCRFRTCYDTTLWPFEIRDASWTSPHQLTPPVEGTDAVGALRVQLDCQPDVNFAKLEADSVRLHLNGEGNLVSTLYELLCNSCSGIVVRPRGAEKPSAQTLRLSAEHIRPVGFDEGEGLLPRPPRAFSGYQLIQEYFAFPEKYFFVDLTGLERVPLSFGGSIEIVFLISPFERPDRRYTLEAGISKETLRLGCTPIVNLFGRTSEPIRLEQRKSEYPIVPDARRRLETGIFSVDEVVAVTRNQADPVRFEPFYSFRHGVGAEGQDRFWHARRRRSTWRDDDADVVISFLDLSGNTVHPDEDSATVRLTCHNGDLPAQLPFGDPSGDFKLEQGIPSVGRILTLIKPTACVQPPLGKPQLWRLISQLSLNYLSLVDGDPEPLRELLRLYNFTGAAAADAEIDGISAVQSEPEYSRVESVYGLGFARGRRVEIEFDEERFAGGGVYLFASVLERFLGLYSTLNSFTALTARTPQRRIPLRVWPPRAGARALA